jgi:hypothetical protein
VGLLTRSPLPKAHPMITIPLVTWIANAAAALTGAYGEVTRQA